jgi:hypothetical protein
MTGRRAVTKPLHASDPWLRLVQARRAGPCDCPCHGYPTVRCPACCANRGRRWIPAARLYSEWQDQ